jgi:hypothetical protein
VGPGSASAIRKARIVAHAQVQRLAARWLLGRLSARVQAFCGAKRILNMADASGVSVRAELRPGLALQGAVGALASSASAELLATCVGRSCFVWSTSKGTLLAHLNRAGSAVHKAALRAVSIAPDGARIATGSIDGRVAVWSLATKKAVFVAAPHAAAVSDLRFARGGALLVSASLDGTVRLLDATSGALVGSGFQEAFAVRSADVAGSGDVLGCALSDGSVALWDYERAQRLGAVLPDSEWRLSKRQATLAGWLDPQRFHTGSLCAARFSPSGAYLATCSYDHTVKLWNVLALRHRLQAAARDANEAEDDSTAHSAGSYATLLSTLRHEAACTHAAFSPDSAYLVTAAQDSTVRVWATASGRLVYQFNLPFSPAELVVAAGGSETAPGGTSVFAVILALGSHVLTFSVRAVPRSLRNLPPAAAVPRYRTIDERSDTFPAHASQRLAWLRTGVITRDEFRRCLAQSTLADAVVRALVADTAGADAKQLEVNLAQHSMQPSDLLRFVINHPAFAVRDLVRAFASADAPKRSAFFLDVATGSDPTQSMRGLGFAPLPVESSEHSVTLSDPRAIFVLDPRVAIGRGIEAKQHEAKAAPRLGAASGGDSLDLHLSSAPVPLVPRGRRETAAHAGKGNDRAPTVRPPPGPALHIAPHTADVLALNPLSRVAPLQGSLPVPLALGRSALQYASFVGGQLVPTPYTARAAGAVKASTEAAEVEPKSARGPPRLREGMQPLSLKGALRELETFVLRGSEAPGVLTACATSPTRSAATVAAAKPKTPAAAALAIEVAAAPADSPKQEHLGAQERAQRLSPRLPGGAATREEALSVGQLSPRGTTHGGLEVFVPERHNGRVKVAARQFKAAKGGRKFVEEQWNELELVAVKTGL